MKSWFRSGAPDFIREYREQTGRRLSRKTRLDELRFVSIDTETSGFDIEKDRLLSIALIEIRHGQIEMDHCKKWMVYQPGIGTTKATEIHGILPAETRQGIPEPEVLKTFLPLLAGAVVIGHNIWFDIQMLDAAFGRHFKTKTRNQTLDIGAMAMKELLPFKKTSYVNQRMPSLEDLCGHLGLPTADRHTAEGDAFLAAEIFLLLCGRMRQRLKRPLRLGDFPVSRM